MSILPRTCPYYPPCGGVNKLATETLDGHVRVSLDDLRNLIYYCDTVALILKENGYAGKAEALESRYMKFEDSLADLNSE